MRRMLVKMINISFAAVSKTNLEASDDNQTITGGPKKGDLYVISNALVNLVASTHTFLEQHL